MNYEVYVVYNTTKNACLASSAKAANSFVGRLKGLMGRSAEEFRPGDALWIYPSDGIHTIGMRFPIDAAYLDGSGRIIRIYHKLAPFRFAAYMPRAKSVLELPAGTLKATRSEIGDLLDFRPSNPPGAENSDESA